MAVFEMPENLGDLSAEDLSDKIEEARGEFNDLNASDDISDETLERMEFLAVSIEGLQGEKIRRVEAAARREELAARVAEPVVEEAPAPEVEASVDSEVEAAAVEAEVEAEDTQVEAAEEVEELSAPEAASDEPETVINETASIEKESIVAASNITSADVAVPEKTRPAVLIAAAQDVPQFYVGQRLDPEHLASALHNKARMLNDSRGAKTVYPVATIERPFGEGYDLEGLDQAATWDRLTEMSHPSALTAAGGWCAPSETVYDLFEVECTSELLYAIPTYRVTRGGIRWPVFSAHDEGFDPGFIWTEDDDIEAATGTNTKPCVRISCPTFTEVRLDAVGLCVTAGNLIDRAYPEQVRWYLNRAVRAYERQNAIRKLNAVIADTASVTAPNQFAAASSVLANLYLQAADYRQLHGLCYNEVLDVVAPSWLTAIFKADIARQDGALTIGSLPSDSEVAAWFQAAGLNLRYIDNWQEFTHPATVWPEDVDVLISYPGAYVEFNQGRLDLGVIRDSTLNATNDFTAVWFEEFYAVGRRGPQGRVVTIPICASGEVGGRVEPAGVFFCPPATS